MKNIDNEYNDKSNSLKSSAKIVGLIFAVLFLLLIIILALFPQGNTNGVRDYLTLAVLSIYPLGLLIGYKRHGLGGLISFIFLFICLIIVFIGSMSQSSGGSIISSIIVILIMMVPVVLYLLTWNRERRKL